MAKKKEPDITWMATVRYPGDVNHVSTFNAPDANQTPEQLDQWLMSMLQEHGTHNARVYVSKVVYFISG